jgi:hypothetical protein
VGEATEEHFWSAELLCFHEYAQRELCYVVPVIELLLLLWHAVHMLVVAMLDKSWG